MQYIKLSFTLLLASICVEANDWSLIWSEEFDGNSLDYSKWSHEVTAWGGGNAEFQTYTPNPNNTYVKDGKLYLKATKLSENINPWTGEPFGEEFLNSGTLDLIGMYRQCTNGMDSGCYRVGHDIPPIASGRVHTIDKFSFRYGRIDINAKMPVGDWLWPAMWLLPQDLSSYGGWPMSGEIDMVEITGNRDYRCDGKYRDIHHMGSAMHWGPRCCDLNMFHLTLGERDDPDNNYGDNFHVYSVEWTPQGISFLVDDHKVMEHPSPPMKERDSSECWTGFYDFAFPNGSDASNPWTEDRVYDQYMAPFDQEFFIILNLAVGGRWYIPDNCTNAGGTENRKKPWTNGGSQRDMMQDFYAAEEGWKSSWDTEGDNNAMQVDWIRVYQADNYGWSEVSDDCPKPPETRPTAAPSATTVQPNSASYLKAEFNFVCLLFTVTSWFT